MTYNNLCDKSFKMIFLDYKIINTENISNESLFYDTFPNVDLLNKTSDVIIRSEYSYIAISSWKRHVEIF